MMDEPAAKNTDRTIWQDREGDYYADSIHVTEGGGIGINCGGNVIVRPLREWHRLASPPPMTDALIEREACPHCRGTGQPGGIMGGPEHGVCGFCMGRGHTGLSGEQAIIENLRRALAAKDAEIAELREALGPLVGKYGDFLAPFVRMMDAELHANAGKGDRPGWLAMGREVGLLEIYYHLAKLQKAVKNDHQADIREFGADVANMSMMLVDICQALDVPARKALGGSDVR